VTDVRRRLVALAALVTAGAVGASCGVPSSSKFQPASTDEIPFELANTTSTTTSTTLAPTTTVPASTSTTTAETTTTLATVSVDVYYVSGSDLILVSRLLAGEATLERVLGLLKSGPPSGDEGEGLRAVIPADADIEVDSEGGVATVDLPGAMFDELNRTDHRLVFGQIVLTLTARPGIGQVRFLLDGEERGVALPGARTSEPGELLSREDYVELLATFTPPATSTTTSTTIAPTTIEPGTVPETVAETGAEAGPLDTAPAEPSVEP
jgi:spore germination protein GerM